MGGLGTTSSFILIIHPSKCKCTQVIGWVGLDFGKGLLHNQLSEYMEPSFSNSELKIINSIQFAKDQISECV